MSTTSFGTFEETALGAFLHDIGKFMQRAMALAGDLPAEVRKFKADVVPGAQSRYTHRHALWSWAFFDELERRGLSFPGAALATVREIACYHHRPLQQNSLTPLVQVADQLASGKERKPKDEDEEAASAERSWTAFIETPLESIFSNLSLDGAPSRKTYIPLGELVPGEGIVPRRRAELDLDGYPDRYRELWERFLEEVAAATRLPAFDLFAETLLSLSERYTFAVPSSVDQPDIPLHDHHRAVAAVACALYRFHEADGSLQDAGRIRDRETPKFRFVVGDLFGIQDGLFRLAAQRVRGANRILRARSFLLSMIVEAGALLLRRELHLAPFSVLQAAGGRFLILAAATPDLEDRLEGARRQVDEWMMDRFLGEVTLNIGLTEPFPASRLALGQFPALQNAIRHAAARAKLEPALRAYRAVHRFEYPLGDACSACAIRPATLERDGTLYCQACDQERRLGGDLPHAHVFRFTRTDQGGLPLFGGLWLDWGGFRQADVSSWCSAFRLWDERAEPRDHLPLPLRFLANYVPIWDGTISLAYERLVSTQTLQEEAEKDSPKLFEMIAADAVEELRAADGEIELAGEALIAVLKADVDRLGELFGRGLGQQPSLARFATLSRMLDFFFSAQLMKLVRESFPSTYTVYAGGDDLLLIGPWRQTLELALRLRKEFDRWTGANPSVTISAGVEFARAHHPLTRTALAAEERLEKAKGEPLEKAKEQGRNRICAVDSAPMPWELFRKAHEESGCLNELVRKGMLSTAFTYKLLVLDAMRRRAEDPGRMDLDAAAWRARWRYLRARHLDGRDELDAAERKRITALLEGLLGLDGSPPRARTAVTIALYRNRTPEARR